MLPHHAAWVTEARKDVDFRERDTLVACTSAWHESGLDSKPGPGSRDIWYTKSTPNCSLLTDTEITLLSVPSQSMT